MSSTPHFNRISKLEKYDICIRQTGVEYNIGYCCDGKSCAYLDDLSGSLRALIKLTAHAAKGHEADLGDYEIDAVIGRLKLGRKLSLPDHEIAPVMNIFLQTLLLSNFDQLISLSFSRKGIGIFAQNLFKKSHLQIKQAKAIESAIEWETRSNDIGLEVKNCLESVFAESNPRIAMKMAFLRKKFMPANRDAAFTEYERTKSNEALIQSTTSNKETDQAPKLLTRPNIDLMQQDLHALRQFLDDALYVENILRFAIIIVNFSRINGFYFSAILLTNSSEESVSAYLVERNNRWWEEATGGDGHIHHWNETQCSWSGLIEPSSTGKKASLQLELECRALREKYLRHKGFESLPTFTIIQPAAQDTQQERE